jgi:hypothetical protein
VAWSGLRRLREVVDRLRPGLRSFRDERGRELLDVPEWLLAEGDVPAPVRFLPEYDNVVLAHRDRLRIIAPEWAGAVRSRIGRPVVLVDGFVAGFWRLDGTGSARGLVIEPLARLDAAQRAGVEAEGRALLDLAAPGGNLRFVA